MSADAELASLIAELAHEAPRLYARWSERTWALCCQGPALRLWERLAGRPGAHAVMADYLRLLREAVGLQYLSATTAAELAAVAPFGAGRSFLAAAFCETLPRLLADAAPERRCHQLADVWNVGEKLVSRSVWLNRYLAARLGELDSLDGFVDFLARVLAEGLDEVPPADFEAPLAWSTLDLAPFDARFLPGTMHLATPSIACVHDRLRGDRHVAVLLRRADGVAAVGLGATPCLGTEDAPPPAALPPGLEARLLASPALPELAAHLVSTGGHVVCASPLSQRLWIGRVEAA